MTTNIHNNINPYLQQIKLLSSNPYGRYVVIGKGENAEIKRAGIIRTIFEKVRGLLRLGDRTSKVAIEYHLIQILGKGAAQGVLTEKNLTDIQIASEVAGLSIFPKDNEANHSELNDVIQSIANRKFDVKAYNEKSDHYFDSHYNKLKKIAVRIHLDEDEPTSKPPDKKPIPLTPKPPIMPLPNLEVSDRILFHIHGDEFGLNSELEGSSFAEPLDYLCKFLKKQVKQGESIYNVKKELLNEILTAAQLAKSLETKSTIKTRSADGTTKSTPEFIVEGKGKLKESFQTRKHILLPGGWTGKPSGHAMYYEVIPDINGKASLRIYNLGSGSAGQTQAIVEGKEKTYPFTEWQGIEKDKILDESFLKAIYEMNTISEQNNVPTQYGPNDIYEGLRELLNPQSEIVKTEVDLLKLMSGQKAGTCAWRSLMAFIATQLNKEDFKRLVHNINIDSLAVSVSKAGQPSRLKFNLIQKSFQKLSRKVQRAYREARIDKITLREDHAVLSKVDRFLHTDHFAAKTAPLPVQITYKQPEVKLTETALVNPIVPLHSKITDQREIIITQPDTAPYHQLVALKNGNQSLLEETRLVENICKKALSANSNQSLELGLIDWIISFPSDAEQIQKSFGNQQQSREIISSLGNISRYFFKNCFLVPQSEIVHPKRIYAMRKLFQIQMAFASQADPLWKNVKTNKITYDDDPLFSFFESQIVKDLKASKLDVPSNSDATYIIGNEIYKYKHRNIGESTIVNFKKKDTSNNSKDNFSFLLRQLAPDAVKSLANDPSFSQLSELQQRARLFASDELPNYIKAIRDTLLAVNYLHKEPVARPAELKGDLSFEFKIKDKEDSTEVLVGVRGIDGKILEEYPPLSEARQNPKFHFSCMYRPFQSPQTKALIEHIINNRSSTEKEIVCDEAALHNIALSDEEFKEISHLFNSSSQSTLRFQKALGYFKTHLDKLNDPDYQTIFKLLFISEFAELNGAIEQSNTLSNHLAKFLESAYKHYRGQNEIQTCTFLLQMANQFASRCPEQAFFRQSITELQSLLSGQSLDPEEKSIIYSELVAQLSNQEKLKDAEVEELLVGAMYIRQNPVPAKRKDPVTEMAVSDAMIVQSNNILRVLNTNQGPNQELINRILQTVEPSAVKRTWKQSSHGDHVEFVSMDGVYRFAPLSRQMHKRDMEMTIPSAIRNHPHFRKFFADISLGVPFAVNTYRFLDKDHQETFVKLDGDQLIIERKIDNKWLRFVPPGQFIQKSDNDIKSTFVSRHLIHNFTHWQDVNDPSTILVINPTTSTVDYTVKVTDGKVGEIRRTGDNALLGKTSGRFDHFENPAYVHEWFNNSHKLIEIEFPRFDLSFKPDVATQRLMCEQKKGYFVDLTSTEPSLGEFNHYLMLTHESDKQKSGKKIVLIPNHKFEAPNTMESLAPHYTINTQLSLENNKKQNFFTYEYNKKMQLTAPSFESGLYLAQVFALTQEYDSAASSIIRHGAKLSRFSNEEIGILESLLTLDKTTGDMSGNALAVRTYAGYCLLNNSVTYQKTLKGETLAAIRENYSKYLKHLRHVTAIELQPEQEVLLLNMPKMGFPKISSNNKLKSSRQAPCKKCGKVHRTSSLQRHGSNTPPLEGFPQCLYSTTRLKNSITS